MNTAVQQARPETPQPATQTEPRSMVYLLHAASALHMGTGAAMGGIDLPHSREVTTQLPNAPGSGIKGVLRDNLKPAQNGLTADQHRVLFGADWSEVDNRDQGALIFSDALLLCLPVASYVGGLAWVTSRTCLRRLQLELEACDGNAPGGLALPSPEVDQAICPQDTPLQAQDHIYLHDIRLQVAPAATNPAVEQALDELKRRAAMSLYPGDANDQTSDQARDRSDFLQRLIVVHDDVLAYLSHCAMDLRTRIAMEDDSKTVRQGGLWVEENLPAESVLWGSISADPIRARDNQLHAAGQSLAAFKTASAQHPRLQIGGKATVGRGVVRLRAIGAAV